MVSVVWLRNVYGLFMFYVADIFVQLELYKMEEVESADELVEVFNTFDVNHDGKISSTDLRIVLKSLGRRVTDVELDEMIRGYTPTQLFVTKVVFVEADRNGDGEISLNEFMSLITGTA